MKRPNKTFWIAECASLQVDVHKQRISAAALDKLCSTAKGQIVFLNYMYGTVLGEVEHACLSMRNAPGERIMLYIRPLGIWKDFDFAWSQNNHFIVPYISIKEFTVQEIASYGIVRCIEELELHGFAMTTMPTDTTLMPVVAVVDTEDHEQAHICNTSACPVA